MADINKHLSYLEARGLIRLVQTHPELEYLFRHGLVQQAAYESLLFEDRKRLHRQVGEAIELVYPNRLEELAPTLAQHFVKAGVVEKAIHYLLLAGDQASGLYAHQEAIDFYRQALELLKEQDDYERAARTLMKLGLTYHNAFDFEKSRRAYEEGFVLWQKAGEIEPVAPPPPSPHALRLAWGDPPTLDPTMAEDSTSGIIIGQFFRGLVEQSPDMNILPEVARYWEVLEDGRKYIFHLRNDVRWSDGTLVTAGDFEYAWKRALDGANGSPHASLLYDITGARAFHQGEVPDPNYVGVYALDETILTVELEEPASYFLPLLAHTVAYPLPRHVVKVHGPAWTAIENLVTNGPFKLESWNRGQSMVLSRNQTYSGRFMGNVEKVELIFLWDLPSSSAKMFEMYMADSLDVFYLDSHEVGQAQRQYPGEYISFPAQWTTYVGFNLNRPPFDNPQVRQAFAMSIDRETWADIHLEGNAPPATGGFVPLGIPGHSAGIGLPYDPDQARHLLAAAGFPKGLGFPTVDALIRFGQESVAEYLQAQWLENLGIEIRWEILEWAKMIDRLNKEPPSIFFTGWLADYDDPDSFLRGCLQQDVFINWQHATYNSLIEEARRVTNQQARLELYRQADKILVTEAVIIPLTYGRLHLLIKPWISKFARSRSSDWHWKDVIIEPH